MAKENKLYVSFLLDETGSMDSIKQQTINGFNEYIANLMRDKNSEEVLFTLTKFNSMGVNIVYNNAPLKTVFPLNEHTYQPNFMTPLYDAIGRTIATMGGIKGKKQKVLMIIQTDGQENDSKEYTQKHIFDLIKEKKEKGWTFVFLGADQDAYAASANIGISRGNTLSYDSKDTYGTMCYAAAVTRSFASTGGEQDENLVTHTSTDSNVGKK